MPKQREFQKRNGDNAERCRSNHDMTDEEEQALRARLAQLAEEHRDLDTAILALTSSTTADQLQLSRLKKRKLLLKDQISQLEDRLLPDIIA